MNKSNVPAPIPNTSSSSSLPTPPPASSALTPATAASNVNGYRLPDNNTLQYAAKLAIVEDKQIMLDYWTYSIDKTVLIGVKENNEKLLVKSEEEYTSPIARIYKVGNEYVVMTENSIYIVDVGIPTKRISNSM